MSVLALFLSGVLQSHFDPSGQDPAAQLGAATAAMVVEWEDTRRPTDRYRFYRRRAARDAEAVIWSVRRNTSASDRDEAVVSSDQCPALNAQMAQLETLQAGPVISPLTTVPPSITLGPALVTVWGRNQTPDGEAQSVMVRSQDGPIAKWGRETLAVISECAAEGRTTS